jgi:hypothetical protein
MSWDRILQNDPGSHVPLRQRIDELFAQQRETWPALRDGEAALSQLERKTLSHDGESIIVQVNPARKRSTHAKTDAKSIAARACFLCAENMPAEERGVAFEDLVVVPNPFPILPLHCTVPSREHVPQQITGRIGTFLRLAAAIGPDMVALYNGPRCGASAPDHFHFQTAHAPEIPILKQLLPLPPGEGPREHGRPKSPERNRGSHLRSNRGEGNAFGHPTERTRGNDLQSNRGEGNAYRVQQERNANTNSTTITPHSTFGRNFLAITSDSAATVETNLESAIDALRQLPPNEPAQEPMLNLLAHFDTGRYTALLFPRTSHRPACYFATGPDQLAISPAVLEMAGLLVTTDPADYTRIDAPTARAIYDEVSLPAADVEWLSAMVGQTNANL